MHLSIYLILHSYLSNHHYQSILWSFLFQNAVFAWNKMIKKSKGWHVWPEIKIFIAFFESIDSRRGYSLFPLRKVKPPDSSFDALKPKPLLTTILVVWLFVAILVIISCDQATNRLFVIVWKIVEVHLNRMYLGVDAKSCSLDLSFHVVTGIAPIRDPSFFN